MIVYRFAHRKYATDLSGTGARLNGGRWNPKGFAAIYASESISLALLEVLANALSLDQLQQLRLMEIEIPDSISYQDIKLKSLKKDWYRDIDYTQWMGQEILKSKTNLSFRCPSAIIPREHNYLIDPLHPDIKKAKLVSHSSFHFDERLFKMQDQ